MLMCQEIYQVAILSREGKRQFKDAKKALSFIAKKCDCSKVQIVSCSRNVIEFKCGTRVAFRDFELMAMVLDFFKRAHPRPKSVFE